MVELEIGELIVAPSTAYVVNNIVGEGTFGMVALCRNMCSNQTVALKVIKNPEDAEDAKEERAILQRLNEFGAENSPIVRCFSSFEYRDSYCLEFEPLDISLCDYIVEYTHMSLMQIRPILYQVAKAMEFVNCMGLIHSDLKPENIMLVDHKSSLQVKLIDFGSAHSLDCAARGAIVQTAWYRAPEVFVGTKYSQTIDMWSLGCIALEMLTGKILFPGDSETDMVRHIVKTVGTPPQKVLCKGKYTEQYFKKRTVNGTPQWRLKSSLTRANLQGRERSINNLEDLYQKDDLFHDSSTTDRALDWEYFIDLVIKLLCLDPEKRIRPEEIQKHPFISMRHMVDIFNTEHVGLAVEMMRQASSLPEHLMNYSSSSSTGASTNNQQMELDEQTEAESSSSTVKKKSDANIQHKSTDQGEASKEKRSPVILKRKGTPHPKSVDRQASSISSSSSREPETEEEDSSRRKSIGQKRKCDAKRKSEGKNTVRFVDGSQSTNQRQGLEETCRPKAVIKRRKGSRHPKAVPVVDQASSSSSNASWETAREDTDEVLRYNLRKRRRKSPDKAVSSSSNDSWKTTREELSLSPPKKKRSPSKTSVDQVLSSSNARAEQRYNLRKRRSPPRVVSSSSNDSWKTAKEELSPSPPMMKRKGSPSKAVPNVDQAPPSSNESWENISEKQRPTQTKAKRKGTPKVVPRADKASSRKREGPRKRRRESEETDRGVTPPTKKKKGGPYPTETPAVDVPWTLQSRKPSIESMETEEHSPMFFSMRRQESSYQQDGAIVDSTDSSSFGRRIQDLNLETWGCSASQELRKAKFRVLRVLSPIIEVSPQPLGGSIKCSTAKGPAPETERPVFRPIPTEEEQVSSQLTPGGPRRRIRRIEKRSLAMRKRSRTTPRT